MFAHEAFRAMQFCLYNLECVTFSARELYINRDTFGRYLQASEHKGYHSKHFTNVTINHCLEMCI